MTAPPLDTVIEHIYDAALEPGRWPEVARLLQHTFDTPVAGVNAGLFVQNIWTQESPEFDRAPMLGFESSFVDAYTAYYATVNPWANAGLFRPGLTITESSLDEHLDQPGAYTETEFYNDWVRLQGLRYSMGSVLKTCGPEAVTFTTFRPSAGPYTRREVRAYERLQPHLARSVEISARLEHWNLQARAWSEFIERFPIALFLLDDHGRLLHANHRGERLLAHGDPLVTVNGHYLGACGRRQDARVQRAIRSALHYREGTTAEDPNSVALGSQGTCLTAVPLSRADPLFSDATPAVAVFVSEPTQPAPLDPRLIRTRYGLTPAELRIPVNVTADSAVRDRCAARCELGRVH